MQRKQVKVQGGFTGDLVVGADFCRKRALCGLLGRGAVRVWVLNLQCLACPATPLFAGYPSCPMMAPMVVIWYNYRRSPCPHLERWFCLMRDSVHRRLVASAGGW